METNMHYDVIVIGSGHSGIEAASASARLGAKTMMCTIDIEKIGLMPCNPSIGGPAKGQIVGEIDALGGEMGLASDKTNIQMKVLNRSRGPAVQCLRSQNDKHDYSAYMKNRMLNLENLTVKEAMVNDLIIEDDQIKGIKTADNETILAKTVVITAGTFLKAKMHIGLDASSGGRIGESSSDKLSEGLKSVFRIGRLKTGTPPRLDHHSIDYSKLEIEPGDNEFLSFSLRTPYNDSYKNQVNCHLTHTNPETHKVILANLDRSPMYTNVIKGIGPRYCPSIEDKVVRFKQNNHHHIFIEPEGLNTTEIYPAGLNTSLPHDVQEQMLKTMRGLEDVKIVKSGYAVEYDFFFPDQLYPTLETRIIKNLYLAGQVNGTSGYEEAAGQGLVAGTNAALRAQNRAPFVLKREDSFIGTMIDDLITKNIFEPYRMMTSRSEYRLLLRQDNAPYRLSEKAYDIGLINEDLISTVRHNNDVMTGFLKSWKKTTTNDYFVNLCNLKHRVPLVNVLRRPEVTIEHLLESNVISEEEKQLAKQALVEVKYEGYLRQQRQSIEKVKSIEEKPIPRNIDYQKILGLKTESREKLIKFAPKTLYDAKKIGGINPADIMILVTYLEKTGIKETV